MAPPDALFLPMPAEEEGSALIIESLMDGQDYNKNNLSF
jgi:hypothetical protein